MTNSAQSLMTSYSCHPHLRTSQPIAPYSRATCSRDREVCNELKKFELSGTSAIVRPLPPDHVIAQTGQLNMVTSARRRRQGKSTADLGFGQSRWSDSLTELWQTQPGIWVIPIRRRRAN